MRLLPIIILTGMTSVAMAHRPSYSDGNHTAIDDAWLIEEIDVSIVLYHEVSCETQELWMEFDAQEGEELFVQLGVPAIDRLETYRPSIAVLAPGLPALAESVPFDVPEGFGALVFHSQDVQEPDDFFEPFTQTSSWIWVEEKRTLPTAGKGYVVAWVPEEYTGRLWVAVGEREDFSNVMATDFGNWMQKTQAFHETGAQTPDELPTETLCAVPVNHEGGCSQSASTEASTTAVVGLLAVLLAAPRLRRRR